MLMTLLSGALTCVGLSIIPALIRIANDAPVSRRFAVIYSLAMYFPYHMLFAGLNLKGGFILAGTIVGYFVMRWDARSVGSEFAIGDKSRNSAKASETADDRDGNRPQ
jgi:hypothetical protein